MTHDLRTSSALLRDRNAPDRSDLPTLSEVFAETAIDGAVTGFVCAQLAAVDKPVLWIQDRVSRRETGRPHPPGLPGQLRVIHVDVSKPVDVLWAMEEGLQCSGLSAVLGEVWGDPAALDFTATKRLALRAEAQARPAILLRRAASPDLSAARLRWRVSSLPSAQSPRDIRAPGDPLWRAELFRARWRTPGAWVARHDDTGLALDHARPASPQQIQASA